MSTFFNGRKLVTPTVESQLLDQQLLNQNTATGNVLAIIGRSEGGAPKTVIYASSPEDARLKLRSGELLTAVQKAFAPSSSTPGPSKIAMLRVNPATQSSLNLLDANTNQVVNLVSTDYGAYTKRIQVKVETGTTSGKKLTVQLDDDVIVRDNVSRDAFTVQYTGGEASATIDVTPTTVVLKAPSSDSGTTIALSDFTSIQTLADKINSISGFVATIIEGSANTNSLYGLDSVTAQDCKTAAYTVKADLQAVVDWFNSLGEPYITASRPNAAGAVPENIASTYLTSGSDGNVTNNDWSDCFAALQNEDVQWVVPLSSDSSIHSMAKSHCIYMSTVDHSERRCFVGGTTGLTVTQAATAAKALNSDRVAYCYPGIYGYNTSGDLTLYPPYMTAAVIAGGFSGITPGNTMTHKPINVDGIEIPLGTLADTDYLIEAGVLAIQKNRSKGVVQVVKAVTTWITDTKFNKVEISTGAAADFTARSVREIAEPFLGSKGSPLLIATVKTAVETKLAELAEPEPGLAVLAGDTANPAFKNVTVSISGEVMRIVFQCSPVIPINYITISLNLTQFSGTSA